MATTIAKIGATLNLDNGKSFTLFEGDIVRGLTYQIGDVATVLDGTVRVINATTRANSTIPDTCPPEPYVHRYVTVNTLVIDSSTTFDAELTRVQASTITDIDSVEPNGGIITVGVGPQYKALADVLADAPAGAVVELTAGEYTDDLTLTKSIVLQGQPGVKMTGKLTFGQSLARATNAEEFSVVLKDLELTGNASLSIGAIDSFEMTGCTFGGHTFTAAKAYAIDFLTQVPMYVKIDGNKFLAEPANCYNLVECRAILKSGSSFSKNYFAVDACAHNQLGLYNVEDDAIIEINDNVFDYTYSGIRIGFKGSPKATVYIQNNDIHATSTDAYAGMCTVQPFAKETATFEGVTLYIDNNSIPYGAIAYMYIGGSDTQLTVEQYPVMYLEGVLTEMTRIM